MLARISSKRKARIIYFSMGILLRNSLIASHHIVKNHHNMSGDIVMKWMSSDEMLSSVHCENALINFQSIDQLLDSNYKPHQIVAEKKEEIIQEKGVNQVIVHPDKSKKIKIHYLSRQAGLKENQNIPQFISKNLTSKTTRISFASPPPKQQQIATNYPSSKINIYSSSVVNSPQIHSASLTSFHQYQINHARHQQKHILQFVPVERRIVHLPKSIFQVNKIHDPLITKKTREVVYLSGIEGSLSRAQWHQDIERKIEELKLRYSNLWMR